MSNVQQVLNTGFHLRTVKRSVIKMAKMYGEPCVGVDGDTEVVMYRWNGKYYLTDIKEVKQ